jgi:endonuclease I
MNAKVLLPLFWALLFGAQSIDAQIPPYYSSVNFNQEGNALKEDLSDLIINTHTTLIPYTSGSTDTWDVIHSSDSDSTISNNVILFYGYDDTDNNSFNDRTRSIAYQQSSGLCISYWNREHVFARSLANPNLVTDFPGPGTDVHNLRAADCQMNSYRSNNYFGDGSGNSFLDEDFYPGDEFKGDVARIIMYMYLRYPTQCEPINIGVGSRSYSDNADMPNIFLEWNEEDPVSEFERNRNEVVYSFQGNRNPFIDNPYLATLIWNGPNAEDSWGLLSTADLGFESVFVHPTIAKDYVYLEGLELSKDAIKIYNQLGQPLDFHLEGNKINISSFSKGIYFISILDQHKSKLFKFLVH